MEDINKDIKELEESIKEAYRCYDYDLDYNPLSKGIAEIIEHLIKAYKELEEENQQLEAIKDEAIRRYNFESIPVFLVEEKIEELNKQYDFYNSDRRETKSIAKGYYIAIQKLEELLEKRK